MNIIQLPASWQGHGTFNFRIGHAGIPVSLSSSAHPADTLTADQVEAVLVALSGATTCGCCPPDFTPAGGGGEVHARGCQCQACFPDPL